MRGGSWTTQRQGTRRVNFSMARRMEGSVDLAPSRSRLARHSVGHWTAFGVTHATTTVTWRVHGGQWPWQQIHMLLESTEARWIENSLGMSVNQKNFERHELIDTCNPMLELEAPVTRAWQHDTSRTTTESRINSRGVRTETPVSAGAGRKDIFDAWNSNYNWEVWTFAFKEQ